MYTETTCGPQSLNYFTVQTFQKKTAHFQNKTTKWVYTHTKDKTCFTKFLYYQFGVEGAIRKALPSPWNSAQTLAQLLAYSGKEKKRERTFKRE